MPHPTTPVPGGSVEPEGPRRLRDVALGLLESHGQDYVREGIRLLRIIQVVAILGAVAAALTAAAILVWLLR